MVCWSNDSHPLVWLQKLTLDTNTNVCAFILGHEEAYIVKENSDSKLKNSEDDITEILQFLLDNIFVMFAGKVFKQTISISMYTNCAHLLAGIFLYCYKMY